MWLILFRVFIVALLAHAGYVYSPFPGQPWLGVGLGVVAALAVIALEMKLRVVPGHHMIGALVGGWSGSSARGSCGGRSPASTSWARTSCTRCWWSSSATWASRSAAPRVSGSSRPHHRRLPRLGPLAPVQGPRHVGDHRRSHRRHLRDRLPGGHSGGAAVRPPGAAAGGRLLRLAEAQPRPARPRHPAEDAEDRPRHGADRRDRLPRGARGRPEAHRARPAHERQDRHQRLQPQQGRPASRRGPC